jgi:type I restriction enzyme S subunit
MSAPLPTGWTEEPLTVVCDVIAGQSPPGSTYNEDGVGLPFFQGKAEFGELYPAPVKWCSAPTKIAQPGDVLLSVRAPVGPTNLCREPSAIGRGLAALRPHEGVPAKYLLYAMRASESALRFKSTGTTFEAVSSRDIRGHRVLVAPPELRPLVVERLEVQLTRIDAAEAALARARGNLRRYRTALVNAAVTEGSSGLALDPSTGVDRPPIEWSWVTVGELASEVRYGTSAKCSDDPTGVPVLRMGNIVNGRLSLTRLKYLPKGHVEFPDLLLRSGDLLFNRTNSPELVGKAAVFRGTPSACSFASYLIRVRLDPVLLPDWLAFVLSSSLGRRWVADVVSQQVGQANVNGTKLKNFRVPVPPLEQQVRLVAEVDRRLSVVDDLARQVEENVRRTSNLRAAVLRDAFAGRLV